jgi:hypothetical protein
MYIRDEYVDGGNQLEQSVKVAEKNVIQMGIVTRNMLVQNSLLLSITS